ncbi:ribose 5-phosphate isomerase B [Magnetococcales bacterium HHB-1]
MRILVACDHGAFELKNGLIAYLEQRQDIEVINLGVDGPDAVDYPDMADKLCKSVLAGEADRGLLLCGTGIGISMAANRHKGIRAALCHDDYSARLSREHNNANVLVIGGRTTGRAVAEGMVDTWLDTPFEGGRHQRRIAKLDQ